MSEKIDLKIENDMFIGMRASFNEMLTNTIKEMKKREVDQSDITLKLTINLFSTNSGDIPFLSHKIMSKMQMKNEQSGRIGSSRTAMIYNEESDSYCFVRVDDGQTSLLSEDEEDEEE